MVVVDAPDVHEESMLPKATVKCVLLVILDIQHLVVAQMEKINLLVMYVHKDTILVMVILSAQILDVQNALKAIQQMDIKLRVLGPLVLYVQLDILVQQ
jgi:hypothetical protein